MRLVEKYLQGIFYSSKVDRETESRFNESSTVTDLPELWAGHSEGTCS